jgi:hypothetical protein
MIPSLTASEGGGSVADLSLFDNLDLDPVYPVDSLVPGEYRRLGPYFWERPIVVVDTRGRT